jgi:alpha-tubulin suppressor-like RCC1 family protein
MSELPLIGGLFNRSGGNDDAGHSLSPRSLLDTFLPAATSSDALAGEFLQSKSPAQNQHQDGPITAVYEWGVAVERPSPSLHNLLKLFGRLRVVCVAANTHKVVVTSRGDGGSVVWCWGDNAMGQCGLGAAGRVAKESHPLAEITKPTAVDGIGRNAIVSAQVRHGLTALVDCNGTVHMCGAVHGTPVDEFERQSVTHGAIIQQFVLGATTQAALTVDGDGRTELLTWGVNTSGQLGHSTLGALVDKPTRVKFPRDAEQDGARIAAIAAGSQHMLALLSNGAIYAWGKNVHVTPDDSDPDAKPPILGVDSKAPVVLAPMRVRLPRLRRTSWVKIVAADSYQMALDRDGRAYAWGENRYGALGVGEEGYRASPTHVRLPRDERVADVAVGLRHTLLLLGDGRVRVCGYGRRGALGLGNFDDVRSPRVLELGGVPVRAEHIAAGHFASIGVLHFRPVSADGRNWFDLSHRSRGVSLVELMTERDADGQLALPDIVAKSIDFVESNPEHLATEGIYRKESLSEQKTLLQQLWMSGEAFEDFPPFLKSVHNVTSTLKMFFRCLEEPLFTYALLNQFFEAAELEPVHRRVLELGRLLRSLPEAHWVAARHLYRHGMRVISTQSNRMGLPAVSRMWGNLSLLSLDQSAASLMRLSQVDLVAKPILEYGHIILGEFNFVLFECLCGAGADADADTSAGKLAFELLELFSACLFPATLEREWMRALERRAEPFAFDEAECRGQLARLERDFDAADDGGNAIAALGRCLQLLDAIQVLRFAQRGEPLAWVVRSAARQARVLAHRSPVTPTPRHFAAPRRIPHPITRLDLDHAGQATETLAARRLQELALLEWRLESQVRLLESQLQSVWRELDERCVAYRESASARSVGTAKMARDIAFRSLTSEQIEFEMAVVEFAERALDATLALAERAVGALEGPPPDALGRHIRHLGTLIIDVGTLRIVDGGTDERPLRLESLHRSMRARRASIKALPPASSSSTTTAPATTPNKKTRKFIHQQRRMSRKLPVAPAPTTTTTTMTKSNNVASASPNAAAGAPPAHNHQPHHRPLSPQAVASLGPAPMPPAKHHKQ